MSMKIYQHYSIFGFSNSYIIGNEDHGAAIIVDPAEITASMVEQIEHKRYRLVAVLITHDHLHHIRGLKTLMRIYDPMVYASNTRILGTVCRKVRDKDVFEEAGFPITAIAVPGHSQDSMIYSMDQYLFTGDALHAGVIGKTTSAFNAQALMNRLRDKLDQFPDETLLFPGHGPPSTLGTERKFNLGLTPDASEQYAPSYDFFV